MGATESKNNGEKYYVLDDPVGTKEVLNVFVEHK